MRLAILGLVSPASAMVTFPKWFILKAKITFLSHCCALTRGSLSLLRIGGSRHEGKETRKAEVGTEEREVAVDRVSSAIDNVEGPFKRKG